MNEQMVARLAVLHGRGLDQPDLDDHNTAQVAWQAWAAIEPLVDLPVEAEDLIDAASVALGHLIAPGLRRRAWECAEAATWGLACPLPQPQLPAGIRHAAKATAARAASARRAPTPAAAVKPAAHGHENQSSEKRGPFDMNNGKTIVAAGTAADQPANEARKAAARARRREAARARREAAKARGERAEAAEELREIRQELDARGLL